MVDKNTQALKRLVKKLSALRATLRSDERALLDQLILGSAAAEVEAHSLTSAAAKGAKVPKPMEVEAHSLTSAAAKGAKVPKQMKVEARLINEMIEFDAQSKVYRVKNP